MTLQSDKKVSSQINEHLSKTRLSNLYSPAFLYLLQIAYGIKDIISQGGYDSLETLLKGENLNNKKLLDAGCGFGGISVYLAKKFAVDIVGVDSEPYMINRANELLKESQSELLGKVSFHTLKDYREWKAIPDQSIDIVISKEMLYHIPEDEKSKYLSEIYRILKPLGKLIITDWLKGSELIGESLTKAMRQEGFGYFYSVNRWREELQKANFQDLMLIDDTKNHIEYTKNDIKRIEENYDLILKNFSENNYHYFLESNQLWLKALECGDLLAYVIFASKK